MRLQNLKKILRVDASDSSKPFVEHLEDLRKTVLWCVGSLLVGMVIAIPLAPWVLGVIKAPVLWAGRDPEQYLRILKVTGGLSLAVRLVFWTGFILSAPIMVLAISQFVFPGLTDREKAAVRNASVFAIGLFFIGVSLCYFMTLKVALVMMFQVNDWLRMGSEFVELGDYTSFVLQLLLAFGLAFELPVVIVALGSVGIVTSGQLRDKRRHVIVGLLVVAMFLTPPDPLTQLLMAVPLIGLYEICIWVIYTKEKRV